MTGTTTEALEQALWLVQAPGRRTILQARPLAAGLEPLLRIATGSAEAIDEAAAATGHPPELISEAVRFYLQQVLFTEDADAYRILGLPRDASADAIRHHHRLLQRWLHPDRSADPWNAVFAARVNQAWTELRDGSRRARYDATLPALPAHVPTPAARWQPAGSGPAPVDQARWLAYAAVAGCAALVLTLVLRTEEPPVWLDQVPATRPAAGETASVEAVAAATDARGRGELEVAERPVRAAAGKGPKPPDPILAGRGHSPSGHPPAIPHGTGARRPMAPPDDPIRPGWQAAAPVPHAEATQDRNPGRNPAHSVHSASSRESLPLPPVAMAVPAPETGIGPPPSTPVPSPDPVPAEVHDASQPQAAAPRQASGAGLAQTAAALPQAPARKQAAAAMSSASPDPLGRWRQAEASLRKTVAYLADPVGARPPLWNDPDAAESAAGQHAGLHARLPMPRAPRIELTSPHWVLDEERARFGAQYTARMGPSPVEQGRMSLELVRREDLWLVADLQLVPSP
jgi:hypothetical protein